MHRAIVVSLAARGLLVAILTMAMPALADDEADRVKEVESSLTRIKEKLDGIASKSSSGDIEEAIREAYRVKEAADKLKSMPAQSEPGKTMGDSYADWVDKFQESMRSLKDMKDAQLKADNDRLGERCIEADKSFRLFVNGYVDKKDKAESRKGAYAIPEEADKIARIYGTEFKEMEEKRRQMESWRNYAKNFSESHQMWSEVKEKLQSGADDIWERWNKRGEAARYCQQLAQGKDNPVAVDALQKLGSETKQMDDRYQELRASYRDWRRDLNSFREAALQDARELKELYCAKLDWEERADQVSNKYASELRSQWDRLTADRNRLLDKADLLVNMGATNASKVKRLIVQAWDKVEPVKDGELQGANHPLIRAQIEKGKAEHKSRQSGADMQNTLIDRDYCDNPHPDRGNCILDYVRGCTLFEVKPNNTEAIDMGYKQAEAYTAGLLKLFDHMQGKDQGTQSEMFTMNSERYGHLRSCVSGSSPGSYSLNLDYKLDTYGFCPGDPSQIFGIREPIPTEDPPEKPIE